MSEKIEKTVEAVKKPFTNWMAFIKGNFVPKEIQCAAYKPYHRADESCHTKMPLTVDNMLPHIEPHGGGFRIILRQGESPWDGWQKLMEKGLELHDFRCDWCDKQIPLSALQIQRHMRSHVGQNRRAATNNIFLFTLSFDKPIYADDELD